MTDNTLVTYESNDRIAVVTINRADKMNALNEELILGLMAAWQRFEDSNDLVAVLHAAGDKAFSVGADIKNPPKEMWQGVPSVGVYTSKPIIAAVHGWCIGGAYCIVQMCDLVVASQTTKFKYPEAQLGFTGGLIASMVARIPHKIAMEFMLLGEELSVERALEVGMVNKIVPAGEELASALAYAEILRHSAPLVVSAIKEFSLATLNQSPAETAAIARETLLSVKTSSDGKEGGRAFAEKRRPSFTGE